ncbi:MAG: DUF2156 domain-containing protein [Myxococcales bacterium]|nr:DUF2156 domain-containing protein [Myxococcales bacterium]MBL0198305.1 DUF2156 domain-containing protein [Myxococcales bacterium]
MNPPSRPHVPDPRSPTRAAAAGAGLEADPDRRAFLALLERYGREATSFVALGAGFRYLWLGDDLCVPYVDTGGAWVAAGSPVGPPELCAAAGRAFSERARGAGREAVLFATEEPSASSAELSSLRVGEQPVWAPADWGATVSRVRSLKEQLRRARAKGVRVERLATAEVEQAGRRRGAVHSLIARWLSTRPMAPMGFVVQVAPFTFASERRYYAAWRGDLLVGFLGLSPIPARDGWLFENLLRDPRAPNGTAELLFDGAMRDLATDGVAYATFGLAPLAGELPGWLALARRCGQPLYDFAGLYAFKAKLRPARWEPVFVSYPRGGPAVVAIYHALQAFAGGGFVRFGLATLLRGPGVVLRALTATLVPWTAALALAAPDRWFPSPCVRHAWTTFDLTLTLCLVALLARWRRALATGLAITVTLDAAVTAAQALLWNAPRARTLGDAGAALVAVSAPALAAAVLWGARRRHARAEAVEGAAVASEELASR